MVEAISLTWKSGKDVHSFSGSVFVCLHMCGRIKIKLCGNKKRKIIFTFFTGRIDE